MDTGLHRNLCGLFYIFIHPAPSSAHVCRKESRCIKSLWTSYLNLFTLHMQQTSVLRKTKSIFCSLSLVKLKWRKYKVAVFPLLRLHSPPAWCVSDHSQPSPIGLWLCRPPPFPPTQFSMSQLQLLFLTQTLMQFKNTVCSPASAISVTSTAMSWTQIKMLHMDFFFFCFVFQKCTLLDVYVAGCSCFVVAAALHLWSEA